VLFADVKGSMDLAERIDPEMPANGIMARRVCRPTERAAQRRISAPTITPSTRQGSAKGLRQACVVPLCTATSPVPISVFDKSAT
jgi:hypothetical protein